MRLWQKYSLRPAKGQTGGIEETLMTYMACGGYAVQAAAALHIHINTLYQRIHKIEEILGMSLSDQEHLLHRNRTVISSRHLVHRDVQINLLEITPQTCHPHNEKSEYAFW